MKWFFISVGIILLCFVSNVQGFAHKETKHTINIALDSSTSDNPFIISDASDLFNHTANNENGQRSFQRLFPTSQKFFFGGLLLNENDELKRKSEISNYVFIAECHIVRFEGSDIIFPFNYFW